MAPSAVSASLCAEVSPETPVMFIPSYGRTGLNVLGETQGVSPGSCHRRIAPSSPVVATASSATFTAKLRTEP